MSATTPTQTLFQVAVGLIPVLLFGGALLGRRDGGGDASAAAAARAASGRRNPHGTRDTLVALGIIAVLIVAMGAELIAINGTFEVTPSDFEIRTVVFALALGTMAVGLSTCIPWAQRVFGSARARHWVYAVAVVAALTVAVISQVIVTNSISGASAIENLNTASAAATTASDQWQSANTGAESARSALLALLSDRSFARLPARKRHSLAGAIDTFAIDVDAAAGLRSTSRFATIANTATDKVQRLISGEISNLLLAQRLEAAVSGLENAEGERAAAQSNLQQSGRQYEQACRAATRYTRCVVAATT